MTKILVTGGAGFIGSNIAERLLFDGYDVVVIDDLSTGSLSNVPEGVLVKTAPYRVSLHSLAHDSIDGIFHLGMPSSSPMYRQNRNLVASTVNDFIDILEFAHDRKLRVVYASSSSVYNGNPTPWEENMPVIPMDFYTEARYSFERLAKVYYSFYGVETIGLRPFSAYGPKERSKGTYANLFSQLLWAREQDEVFEVYGDGTQKRDLIYAADVARAFVLAMNSGIKCDIFNIGTGKSYTVNEMATLLGAKVRYVDNPLLNYVQHTLADTTKARKALGFEAKVSLEEGLRRLVALARSEGTEGSDGSSTNLVKEASRALQNQEHIHSSTRRP